jgi:hypothetical protein
MILLAMDGLAEMVVMRVLRAVSSLTYEEHVRYKLQAGKCITGVQR